MRKTIIIAGIALLICAKLTAQDSIEQAVATVEQNNLMLKALTEQAESDKYAAKSLSRMTDPEVDFAYLWGDPTAIGKRKDLSITQSIDAATAFGYRRRVAEQTAGVIDTDLEQQHRAITGRVRAVCIEIVRCNIMEEELERRLGQNTALAKAYEERFEKGDANIMELNNARIELAEAVNRTERNRTERAVLLTELTALNGNLPIGLTATRYESYTLPDDFERWYESVEQSNPALRYARSQVELSSAQLKLSKAESAPSITGGYMSETVVGEAFRGIKVGASIPLWNNRSRIRQAQAAERAAQLRAQQNDVEIYNNLLALYNSALSLGRVAATYRQALDTHSNLSLLRRALEEGQITMIDYIKQTEIYYDIFNSAVDAERDYRLALARLRSAE